MSIKNSSIQILPELGGTESPQRRGLRETTFPRKGGG